MVDILYKTDVSLFKRVSGINHLADIESRAIYIRNAK